jgi:glycosyltransferase involved in cell wall biosynthesis
MSIDSQPLVSVVTPVYNGEKYLAECIESVLGQTYRNWDYLIVNNCSTDRSLEIAQCYAEKDGRIRVHTNRRLMERNPNHNSALQQISAASKYCKMLHADDWLFPDCLTQMVNVGEAYPSVGVVGAYGLSGGRVRWDGLEFPSTYVSGREICRRTLLDKLYVFGCPSSLLIRSDLIRSRASFYNEANDHSDKEVCLELLQNADFGFVHQVLTYQRIHDEQATVFSDRVNTYLPGNLMILTKYGPIYLDDEEYERCLSEHMESYYRFLAQSLLYRRDKQLIEYHKNRLQSMGYGFSRAKLLTGIASEIVDILGNPKKTLEGLGRRIRRIISTNSQARAVKSHERMHKESGPVEEDLHA